MNIKINKQQFDFLMDRMIHEFIIGSHLYGTNTESSDKDILIMYEPFEELEGVYVVPHMFQYDGEGEQYMFTTINQFWRNLLSGESTINADIVLYDNEDDEGGDKFTEEEKLNILRTYNTIKAFLGVARRDIKDLKQGKGKNKVFHIHRGLYCAECLLDNELPNLNTIRTLTDTVYYSPVTLSSHEKALREICNRLYEKNELTLYPKKPLIDLHFDPVQAELEKLLIDSLNIKEFRY